MKTTFAASSGAVIDRSRRFLAASTNHACQEDFDGGGVGKPFLIVLIPVVLMEPFLFENVDLYSPLTQGFKKYHEDH